MVDSEAMPVIDKRGNFANIVTEGYFPQQTLPEDFTSQDVDQIFGVFPDPNSKKGKTIIYEADGNLRDYENVPLTENIIDFFLREVRPYVEDAWINDDQKLRDEIDQGIGKVGYEINFNRVFFKYQPPRNLKEIDLELSQVENRIMNLLQGVTK